MGGGISSTLNANTVTAQNTILAYNSAGTGSDCVGTINISDYIIVSNKSNCIVTTGAGNQFNINPQLGAFNAGQNFYPLLLGSPAIDSGNPNTCLTTDQLGFSRPQGFACDIGAIEYVFNHSSNLLLETYNAGNGTSLPGTFVCDQTDLVCAVGDTHAKEAHKYAAGTYNLYKNQYNRNSIDGNGIEIISTVHFDSGYDNAFWNGYMMIYGDASGWPFADDIVAHELTHGVTQYESNLFYYYQSGAINESFSDLWGEYYDQTNNQGNDTAGVKWLIGENITGLGAIRSMKNPPAFGDPDKMSSPYYYEGASDNGGVHWNSGVNNKAVYLMVDGGTFNGRTVSALGWEKTAAIYYEVNTNLLVSGADYSDLYFALQQACTNLIGQHGITSGDCTEVKDALNAVQMNGQPSPNYNTEASYCPGGGVPFTYTFTDDLEFGTENWTFTNGASTRWQYDFPYGQYAKSGEHFLYANDYPAAITDARAQLDPIVIPPKAFMRFAHAYDFEADSVYWDGGVLEYSTNGGSTWVDARPLIQSNGYDGTIYGNWNNPLKGRKAFVGASHGYVSTRVDLSSLAGQTVSFRWRMGLDNIGYAWGWWIDDVEVYRCDWYGSATITSNKPVIAVGRPHVENEVLTYNSFASGSTNAYVPMLFKDAFGGSYDSALYVENLDSSNSANITIRFYDSSGVETHSMADTLSPLASRGYWLPSISSLGTSWVGGVKVESNRNIVAVGRPHVGSQVMTYNGFAGGSTNVYVPMLFKDAFGGSYDSALYIQNVDPSNTANITIRFYDSSGTETYSMPDTIQPLASKGYWLPSISALGSSWVGGVKVEFDQDIIAVGRPHIGSQVLTYNGFTSGALNAYVPMMFKDAFGGSYDSALYIQNVDPSNTANITIRFYDNSGTETYSTTDSISALASKGYWLPAIAPLGTSWVGGVKVESDHDIVAVGRPHVGSQIMAYNGFVSGSVNAYVPMLFRDAFGGSYDSALYVQNVSGGTANVTIKFYDTDGNLSCTVNDSISALASKGWWLPGLTCSP